MTISPLACDMNVFSPAERDRHVQNTRELFAAVQEVHETGTGFDFVFSNGSKMIDDLAEFISKERLCCPFLEFSLKIGPHEQPISLSLAGPEGTREFLREEFTLHHNSGDEVFA